ncbi:MAG: NADPH-dependent FMN reductase [Alphaproteobacteria bacterium]|tara:strand:- start:222 stop:743 length:522 start_codon:yes stop_codon:yes gene_type:complete
MTKLLIISSTKNTNLELSSEIKKYIENQSQIKIDIISLEDFNLPLYTPTLEKKFKNENIFPSEISKLKNLICSSSALIWCSPEYNGGISPIVTNAIAWISRATENWKDGFKDKHSLICSSSGGNGNNFVKGFSIQLDYLGSIVFDRHIIKTNAKDIDKEQFSTIIDSFCSKLK